MKDKIEKILEEYKIKGAKKDLITEELCVLFNVSKRQLIESALDDMKSKHSEYHYECLEDYLIDGC